MINSPGLYLATSPSNRGYIGMTLSSFNRRYREHLRHPNISSLIGKAFKKYGEEMKMEPLVVCKDREALYGMERRAIILFDTAAPVGYNLSPGGGTHKFALMNCLYCGEEFEGRIGVSKFCSNTHKNLWRRASGVDNETRECVRCGDSFVANKYEKCAHCSRSCANKYSHQPHTRRSF